MVSGINNSPPQGVSSAQALNQIKSEIDASDPKTKSQTTNPNEFNIVEKTNQIEAKPILQQNNLGFSQPSASRGTNLDISV
jgi:hypothetical protein